MVLQAYIDDSKDQNREHHMVLAGYLASPEEWAAFSIDWANNLKEHNLEEFKCSSMPHNSYPEFTANFYRIIEKHIKYSFSCHIDLIELKGALENLPDLYRQSPVGQKLQNPYFITSKYLLSTLYQHVDELLKPEPIDIIFDEQTGEDRVLLESFPYMKYCLTNDTYVGATPVFKNSKEHMPLQAADLIAWHIRKALEQGKDINTDQIFDNWECKKDIKTINIWLKKGDLQKEVDFLFSDENFMQLLEYDGYTLLEHINEEEIIKPVPWQTTD